MGDAVPVELEGQIVPYLLVRGANEAIDFYRRAFGAEERFRMELPDGTIGHAEIVLGGAVVFLADAPADMAAEAVDPDKGSCTTVLLHRYVTDVDTAVAQAESAGATVVRPPEVQFYGNRAAVLADPWGHHWSLHTHIRDVTPEELAAAGLRG